MIHAIRALYTWMIPPGGIILVLTIVGLRWRGKFKSVSAIILAVAGVLYVCSLPLPSHLLLHSLETRYVCHTDISGDAIIMLTGGANPDAQDFDGPGQSGSLTASRLITAAKLHRKLGVPIIVSGGQLMEGAANEADIARRDLLALGISTQMVLTDESSRTTRESAENIKGILEAHSFRRPILVTSAFHMQRALHLFTLNGVRPEACPTAQMSGISFHPWWGQLVPAGGALMQFGMALKEYLGLLQH